MAATDFNPRSRKGSDVQLAIRSGAYEDIFQSTLPQGERHHRSKPAYRHTEISIHAPARGATDAEGRPATAIPISIHAPARGATRIVLSHLIESIYFNPRSRKGSDAYLQQKYSHYINFNPRSRKGSDYGRGLRCLLWRYFNPRSRKGSDLTLILIFRLRLISIHAPARGATVNAFFIFFLCHNFNPRSRKGSDNMCCYIILHSFDFNPRSRKGSDLLQNSRQSTTHKFQSTLPQGERLPSF